MNSKGNVKKKIKRVSMKRLLPQRQTRLGTD